MNEEQMQNNSNKLMKTVWLISQDYWSTVDRVKPTWISKKWPELNFEITMKSDRKSQDKSRRRDYSGPGQGQTRPHCSVRVAVMVKEETIGEELQNCTAVRLHYWEVVVFLNLYLKFTL